MRAERTLHRRIVVFVWMIVFGACTDNVGPNQRLPPPTGLIISNPIPAGVGASGAGLSASLSAGDRSDGDVVYVSLPRGTIPNGGLATIRDARTGSDASAPMAEGGFDPVPLHASAGDTLAVTVRLEGGGSQLLHLVVPTSRRPVVVRTDPPPRKRDVALNAAIVVVFSEPVGATSGSGIQVLQNGSPVSGSVVLTADRLRAEFRPTQSLSPNTDYVLSIARDVADLTGDEMESLVTAEFTTGTTVIAASVATDPVALFTNPFTQTVRTFEMRAILDGEGQVTGTFSVFFPQNGVRYSGRVTCFTIVGGDSAWVGGIIDSVNVPSDVGGKEAVWRAVDKGTPSPTVHDQLSLVDPGLGPGAAHDWCANRPLVFPEGDAAELIALESGDIVVNASGGPPPPPAATAAAAAAAGLE